MTGFYGPRIFHSAKLVLNKANERRIVFQSHHIDEVTVRRAFWEVGLTFRILIVHGKAEPFNFA